MLSRDFTQSKMQYVKKNKLPLIIIACVVVIGILVAGIFGFNSNPDFSGGKVVDIHIQQELSSSELDDYTDKLNSILASQDLSLYSVQIKGEGVETYLEVKYQGKTNQTKINNVNKGIVEEFALSLDDISKHQTLSKTVDSTDYIYTIVAGLIILVLASIFVLIRHNIAYAMCLIGSGLFSVIGMLATFAILRLEIGASFMFIVLASMIFTIFEALIWFENMREVRRNKEYKEDLNKQIVLGLKNTTNELQFTSIALFVIGLIMVIFGTNLTRNIALNFMFAVVIALISLMFILPLIYNLTVDKAKFKPFKTEKDKKQKSKDESKTVKEEKAEEVKDDNQVAPVEEKEAEEVKQAEVVVEEKKEVQEIEEKQEDAIVVEDATSSNELDNTSDEEIVVDDKAEEASKNIEE